MYLLIIEYFVSYGIYRIMANVNKENDADTAVTKTTRVTRERIIPPLSRMETRSSNKPNFLIGNFVKGNIKDTIVVQNAKYVDPSLLSQRPVVKVQYSPASPVKRRKPRRKRVSAVIFINSIAY